MTGAAGFIASNLLPRLLAEGHEIAAIDNFVLGQRAYIAPCLGHSGFSFYEQDLLDLPKLASLFEAWRPELVWHLAANSDIALGDSQTDFDLRGGPLATYHVLEAMRKSGTAEIIFASSGAIYGEPTLLPTPESYGPLYPISLYAASKLACETLISAYAHNFGIKAWIYRFANIVGKNPTHGVIYDFVRKLTMDPRELRVLGDGRQCKPYVYVEDCLDGMLYGYRHARDWINCFNLSGPDRTAVREIAEWTLLAMGLTNTRIIYSGGHRGFRGDVPTVHLDGTKMCRLGWAPRLSSSQAVKRAIADIVHQLQGTTWVPFGSME